MPIYAMQFWRDHIRDAPFDVEKLVALSENDEFMQTREQLDYNNYWSKWKTAKTLAVEGPIALAAQVGLTNVVAKLAETTTSLRELGAAIATAARYGNGDMIDVLVKSDVLKSTRTLLPGIEAALEIACHHNAVSVLTPLLEYIKTSLGPPADDFAVLLSSLLCNAAKYGYTALMKLLVTTYGAQVDQSFDEKMRPLQQAIYYGHAKAARYLVEEAGAIIYENDSSDDDDDSLDSRSAVTENTDKNTNVLYIAAENGHTTIVELLLNNTIVRTESHTNGKSTASSDDSDTDHNNSSARKAVTNWSVIEDALVVACKKSHVDTAKHIFGHPAVSSVPASQRPFNIALLTAAVRAEVRPESKSLAMHIINSIMPSKRIADLIHPFVYAADNGQLEFVRYCLALDNLEATSALVNSAGDRGMKALNAAATKGNVDIVKCLLDRGADVNGLDSTQLTPLAQAAVAGHVETVKTLLENGADAAWIGSMSRGILASTVISAKCERAVDVVQLLLQAGAPVNALDRSKMTPLHLAARRGHLNILDVLLAQDGIDPTITGDRDMTALHSAAESSSRNAIRAALKLIAAGVGTQKQDVDGRLPLHIAASSWNGVDLVEFLLSKDQSSLNARTNNGDTVLHAAYKTCDTLIWLIDNGFDVDAENNEGKTTLMSAAERGVEESVGLLMSYGANTDMLDRSSRTALHHAVNAKNHSISNMLLDANPAVLFQLDSTGTSVLYTSISRGMREFALRSLDELEKYARAHKMEDQIVRVLDSVVSTTYRTPILLAARRSETKLVKRILQLGGSTDQRDYMGSSALYYAIDKGNEDMVRAILSMRPETAKGTADRYIANKDGVYRQGEGRGENGDDDDGDDDDSRDSSMRNDRFRNRSHPAALQSAAALGLVDMVKLLLSYGVDINEESGQLNTALTAAAAGGFTHVVRLLLEHGADTTLAGGSYPNALCAAVASTSPATIDALLAKDKTAVLARDVQGRNALHVAVQSRSLDAFEKILGVVESLSEGLEGMPYGSALDADKQGRRILHFAASAGDVDALRYFLEHPKLRLKDEIDILDNDGWTPLHWACRLTEGEECVDLLLDYKSDPNLETRDGWTPLNIAQYHDATGSVDLIETALRQRARQIFHRNAGAPTAASDRATDMAVDSNSQTHTHTHSHEEYDMKLEAGFLNWGVTCDGCLLMVCLFLAFLVYDCFFFFPFFEACR
ncbi:hypothetical protein SBRCBS47491_001993 [Sporothrix bragantina]|uniref:Ankyrin repeat protein n=1 Tax=Sporothrix bragantina TaxID=671064 RepID=A0ABP0B388_9PEZI